MFRQIDEDEEALPIENFLILSLENGFSIAIRPSGTEPKIKFYIFGLGDAGTQDLQSLKEKVDSLMDSIGAWLLEDAHKRSTE